MSHDCPLTISDDHQLPPSSGTLEQLEVADACGGVTTILTRAQLEQAEMQAGIALEMLAIPVDRQGKALPEDQMQRLLAKRDEMRSRRDKLRGARDGAEAALRAATLVARTTLSQLPRGVQGATGGSDGRAVYGLHSGDIGIGAGPSALLEVGLAKAEKRALCAAEAALTTALAQGTAAVLRAAGDGLVPGAEPGEGGAWATVAMRDACMAFADVAKAISLIEIELGAGLGAAEPTDEPCARPEVSSSRDQHELEAKLAAVGRLMPLGIDRCGRRCWALPWALPPAPRSDADEGGKGGEGGEGGAGDEGGESGCHEVFVRGGIWITSPEVTGLRRDSHPGAPPDGGGGALRCREGHVLKRERAMRSLKCDVCSRRIDAGEVAFSCLPCDHDMCLACGDALKGAQRPPPPSNPPPPPQGNPLSSRRVPPASWQWHQTAAGCRSFAASLDRRGYHERGLQAAVLAYVHGEVGAGPLPHLEAPEADEADEEEVDEAEAEEDEVAARGEEEEEDDDEEVEDAERGVGS
jgi:hypothetical protein